MAESLHVRKSVISGSCWAILSQVVFVATGFASVPLALGYLGEERMGLWRLTTSLLLVVTLLNAGLIPHVKTRMAESFGQKDKARFVAYSSTSLLIGLSIVLVGFLVALLVPLVDWVRLMKVMNRTAQIEVLPLVVVIVVCTFAQVGSSFIPAIFDARMQVSQPRIYELAGRLAGFLLLVVGIHLQLSLPWLAALMLAPTILLRVLLLVKLFRIDRAMVLPHWQATMRILPELVRPAILAVAIHCGTLLLGTVPNLMVVRMFSLSDVTLFSLCYQVATVPLNGIAAVVPVFWPAFTLAWTAGACEKVGRWLLLICCGTAGVLVLYAISFSVLGPWLFRWWTKGVISPARPLLLALGLFVVAQGLHHWVSTFLWSVKDLWVLVVTQAASAALLVVLGFLLGGLLGLSGIVIAMTAAVTIGGLVPLSWRAWKLVAVQAAPRRRQLNPLVLTPSSDP